MLSVVVFVTEQRRGLPGLRLPPFFLHRVEMLSGVSGREAAGQLDPPSRYRGARSLDDAGDHEDRVLPAPLHGRNVAEDAVEDQPTRAWDGACPDPRGGVARRAGVFSPT